MFAPAERALLRDLFEHPEDLARREVLADVLLERGLPLGELLRLESERVPDPRRFELRSAVEAALAPLYPRSRSLVHVRGLPAAGLFEAEEVSRASAERKDPAWPLRHVALQCHGALGAVHGALQAPLFAHVEELDLSSVSVVGTYTQFVGSAPEPMKPLPRLRWLALPESDLPKHWRPVLPPAFARARVVRVHPQGALPAWLGDLFQLERLELWAARGEVGPAVADGLREWAEGRGGDCLRVNGRPCPASELDARLAPAPVEPRGPAPATRALAGETELRDPAWGPGKLGDREDARLVLLSWEEEAAAAALLALPRHPNLLAARGLATWRARPALEVDVGRVELEPLPAGPVPPDRAFGWARQLASALASAWVARDTFAPGGLTLLPRRFAFLRGGELAVLPLCGQVALRRWQPAWHGAVAGPLGVPVRVDELGAVRAAIRVASAALCEWLTGRPVVPASRDDDDFARRHLLERLETEPPVPSDADRSLERYDALVRDGLLGRFEDLAAFGAAAR